MPTTATGRPAGRVGARRAPVAPALAWPIPVRTTSPPMARASSRSAARMATPVSDDMAAFCRLGRRRGTRAVLDLA